MYLSIHSIIRQKKKILFVSGFSTDPAQRGPTLHFFTKFYFSRHSADYHPAFKYYKMFKLKKFQSKKLSVKTRNNFFFGLRVIFHWQLFNLCLSASSIYSTFFFHLNRQLSVLAYMYFIHVPIYLRRYYNFTCQGDGVSTKAWPSHRTNNARRKALVLI